VSAPDVSPSHILIVDDEADLRALMRKTLERAGYELVEAADGREAIRSFRERTPALVITDIFMPEMDGLELIMTLRDHVPLVPIIVISGGGRHQDGTAALAARALGAKVVLTKPFTSDDILTAVRRLLGARDGDLAG
jgi:CheY-like chemotaxis protein